MARVAQDSRGLKSRLPESIKLDLRRSGRDRLNRLVLDHGRLFGLPEVRQLLLNPFVDGEILQEVASIRHLTSAYPVKAALARHWKTPEPVAMRLVPHLFWRELLEICVDVRIRGPVRRAAERYLLERLSRLTLGEKISLARRIGPSAGRSLVVDAEPEVLSALMQNPRMTEEALMPLLTSDKASPQALYAVAEHPRWGTRYEIRSALCRNPQTPFSVVLRLLPELRREDLSGVATVAKHSGVVLRRVEELLEIRS